MCTTMSACGWPLGNLIYTTSTCGLLDLQRLRLKNNIYCVSKRCIFARSPLVTRDIQDFVVAHLMLDRHSERAGRECPRLFYSIDTGPDVRFGFCNRLPHSSASLVDCGSVATQSRYVDMPTCCHMSPLRETQRAGMLMAYAKIMSQAVITLTLTYTKTLCGSRNNCQLPSFSKTVRSVPTEL